MEASYSAYMLEFEQFVLRFVLNVNHWVKTIEPYGSQKQSWVTVWWQVD